MNKSQNENVFVTFFSHKMHVLDLLSSFYRPEWQIFLPCHILQQAKSLPLWYTKASKRYPFRGAGGGLPVWAIIGRTPRGLLHWLANLKSLRLGQCCVEEHHGIILKTVLVYRSQKVSGKSGWEVTTLTTFWVVPSSGKFLGATEHLKR